MVSSFGVILLQIAANLKYLDSGLLIVICSHRSRQFLWAILAMATPQTNKKKYIYNYFLIADLNYVLPNLS